MSGDIETLMSYFHAVRETREGFQACCPACGDRKWKLYFNIEKKVGACFHSECRWFYQRGGVTLSRALAFFSAAGLELGLAPEVIRSAEETEVKLPKEYREISRLKPDMQDTLYAYMASRGIPKKVVDAARVGYCRDGRWWGYLVFPVLDDEGNAVYWQARRFKNREPKFYNPKASYKSELVYRISPVVRPKTIVLVESIINVLTLENMGIGKYLVMAILGKSMSETQLQYILRFEKRLKDIVVALDGDARREAVEIAEKLWAKNPHIASKIAPIPDGEDINSLGREEAWRRIAYAEPFDKRHRSEIITRKTA